MLLKRRASCALAGLGNEAGHFIPNTDRASGHDDVCISRSSLKRVTVPICARSRAIPPVVRFACLPVCLSA